MQFFGGLEGGATSTRFCILNQDGEVVASEDGLGTNFFLNSFAECYARIGELVNRATASAGLSPGSRLKSLGLCMSGAEHVEHNAKFLSGLAESCALADSYELCSDSVGTIVTALKDGGVVVVAGTGSSCRLLNPSNRLIHCCGGWGHLIGDGGSAFWIAQRAVQRVFDVEDGLERSESSSIEFVKQQMLHFFHTTNRLGVLDHLYVNFNKAHFAQFCRCLAVGATEHHDPLCLKLFEEAGFVLGRHILAVCQHADPELLAIPSGLPVVTVGSVWKSWELMQSGFLAGLRPRDTHDVRIGKICLHRLTASAALGAAYLGAQKAGVLLPLDFSKNAQVYFQQQL